MNRAGGGGLSNRTGVSPCLNAAQAPGAPSMPGATVRLPGGGPRPAPGLPVPTTQAPGPTIHLPGPTNQGPGPPGFPPITCTCTILADGGGTHQFAMAFWLPGPARPPARYVTVPPPPP